MNTLQGSFSPSKKPQKKVVVDNPFEALEKKEQTVVESVAGTAQDAVKDMWAQILGADKYSIKAASKGDLKPGQAVDLKEAVKPKEQPKSEAPMSYFKEIKEAGQTTLNRESAEIRQQVQTIMYELQRLAASSKELSNQVAKVTGQGVVSPGKYHVNFFEWMFAVVKDARKRVENAASWLGVVKKKKGFVAGMKKNMSQFMSGERSVSNQTA